MKHTLVQFIRIILYKDIYKSCIKLKHITKINLLSEFLSNIYSYYLDKPYYKGYEFTLYELKYIQLRLNELIANRNRVVILKNIFNHSILIRNSACKRVGKKVVCYTYTSDKKTPITIVIGYIENTIGSLY